MVAEVTSDGRRRGCFSGCRGANEWVRLNAAVSAQHRKATQHPHSPNPPATL